MTTSKPAPSRSLQVLSIALPVLKCAVCPACLSIFGGLFAGARMGMLGDERIHGWVIALALTADVFILWSAIRHHRNRWPLGLCFAGAMLAVSGHFIAESLEFAGFGLLMIASLQNAWLIRRHRHIEGSCCCGKNASNRAHHAVVLTSV